MEESNFNYDLESYMNQMKFKLNTAIYSVTNISNKGNQLSRKIQDLYTSIEKLNGKLDDNKFYEITDIANIKSDELNSYLKMLTHDIPSEIEYTAKMEAKDNKLNLPDVKYYKCNNIRHIHSGKSNRSDMGTKQVVDEINTKLDDIIQLTDSLNDLGCNYNLCQYKVSNVANNITNISQSLMSNIEQRCNEDNI